MRVPNGDTKLATTVDGDGKGNGVVGKGAGLGALDEITVFSKPGSTASEGAALAANIVECAGASLIAGVEHSEEDA